MFNSGNSATRGRGGSRGPTATAHIGSAYEEFRSTQPVAWTNENRYSYMYSENILSLSSSLSSSATNVSLLYLRHYVERNLRDRCATPACIPIIQNPAIRAQSTMGVIIIYKRAPRLILTNIAYISHLR